MSLLFCDIESSGLIIRELPLADQGQPWMITMAALHVGRDGTVWNAMRATVRPEGRKVKPGAKAVHQIEERDAERNGVPEGIALNWLAEVVRATERVVTYGDFDVKVIESLLMRLEEKYAKPFGTYVNRWRRPGLEFVNVMVPAAQQACRLPSEFGDGGYRWPKLSEAAEIILGRPLDDAHDAWADMTAVKDIYFALKERGHF